MARGSLIVGSSRNRIGVSVKGMDSIRALPGWVEYGQRAFVSDFAGRMAGKVASLVGRRVTGRLSESWGGEAFSSTKARVFSDSKYALARDRGAFIQAKPGHVLRFPGSDGEWVYRRFTRQRGTHYVDRALKERRRLAEEAFADAFERQHQDFQTARRVLGATYNPHLRGR